MNNKIITWIKVSDSLIVDISKYKLISKCSLEFVYKNEDLRNEFSLFLDTEEIKFKSQEELDIAFNKIVNILELMAEYG